jgi:hypothetical protein
MSAVLQWCRTAFLSTALFACPRAAGTPTRVLLVRLHVCCWYAYTCAAGTPTRVVLNISTHGMSCGWVAGRGRLGARSVVELELGDVVEVVVGQSPERCTSPPCGGGGGGGSFAWINDRGSSTSPITLVAAAGGGGGGSGYDNAAVQYYGGDATATDAGGTPYRGGSGGVSGRGGLQSTR